MIKLGIIGAGRMGITHYSIINSSPDVEITAVADPSGLILTMIDKYLPVKTFKDYNDMFEKAQIDAVLVCTPPVLHYIITKKAIEMGIHVFVEKPFTTKFNQASELAQLCANTNLTNQVGYVNRFNQVFIKAQEFINEGLIGKVIRFKSEMFSSTLTKSENSSNWRATREGGGGVLFEMASHAINLVNFLVGVPDKVVGSALNSIHSKEVEDTASTTFLYNNGIIGTLYVNWCDTSYRKPTNKIEIFGLGGRILADQHSLKIFLNEPNEKHKLRKGWNTLYITDIFKPVPFYVRGNEFTSQLYHFVDSILGKTEKNICSFSDGADTLEIIESIIKDYETNSQLKYEENR